MKTKTVFSCQSCGFQSPKWLGKCPDCESWNSFVEEDYASPQVISKGRTNLDLPQEEPVLIKDVHIKEEDRLKSGIAELDRVLGGGLVPGSVVLIGGDPGIGKSTISLQFSHQLMRAGAKVLYVSAEESVTQTKLRAQRLGIGQGERLYIVNQADLGVILEFIRKLKPDLVIVDSIQVISDSRLTSAAGSVSQVRECAATLARFAKGTNISIFIIGHVTKEGTLAGPRVLEHIVDTVLYFEGERFSSYRILRAVKNRFGSTNEIGVFEMGTKGLCEVENPSQIFLAQRPTDVSGSVVISVLEGTRPILVEVQALVSKTGFGYPLRRAEGFDYNRLSLLVAVLEKRIGLSLETEDIFVNVAGGIKVEDPAADLGVAAAVASAFRGKPVDIDVVLLGEVGLAGEIRSVSQSILRINEAQKLGFKRCILPKNNLKGLDLPKANTIKLEPVATLKEALDLLGIN